mmetsp:Transcript_10665/g.19252  ORF Transcript_10665/g.19252 Transcript_10665/m.19252 type:complete len:110 (-) Transcript_10665:1212-1541(-)
MNDIEDVGIDDTKNLIRIRAQNDSKTRRHVYSIQYLTALSKQHSVHPIDNDFLALIQSLNIRKQHRSSSSSLLSQSESDSAYTTGYTLGYQRAQTLALHILRNLNHSAM